MTIGQNMQLNIDRLIAYFGGVNALAEALKQQDPQNAASTAAIYKWRTRGSLPLAQLQKLTALAEAQGRPLDLNAFMQQQTTLEKNTMTTSQNNRVIIFDTTMRDGEQSPGASMTKEEKIRIARQLEKMGVDVIEAGFAAASPGDFESVNAIAKSLPTPPSARWRVPLKTMSARRAKPFPPRRKSASTSLSPPAPSIWSTS